MTSKKTDRRTRITKKIVKDALLELLSAKPYEKLTIAALCRQAEITRATFYLHYNNLDEVLNEVLDDAIQLAKADKPDADTMLPVCQWTVSDPKYRILFADENLSRHILNKIYRIQKGYCIPKLAKDYGVTEWEAEKIFRFILYGNFAVNESFKWERTPEWDHVQEIIRKLVKP